MAERKLASLDMFGLRQGIPSLIAACLGRTNHVLPHAGRID